MEHAKISVIIPVYNKEKYVEGAIDSIIKQTYSNLEILIVNDGSTDGSRAICEKKALEDKRIILINTPNQGAGAARNTGFEKATGEYISFIDADDYVIPTYYETLLQMLENTGADIAQCRFQRTNGAEDKLEAQDSNEVIVLSNKEKIQKLYGRDFDEYTNSVIMCNKLFRRELFKDGIRYPVNKVIDDEFIIYHLIYNSNKVVETNQVMYNYIQSEGSTMRGELPIQRIYDTLDIYDEVYDFFADKDIDGVVENILIRYFEYGVDLMERVNKSSLKNKNEIKQYIKNRVDKKLEYVLTLNINQQAFEECKNCYSKLLDEYSNCKDN